MAEAREIEAASDYIKAADDGEIYPEEEKLLDEAKTNLATADATPSPMISAIPAELSPTPTASPR
jgi:hypothetical protein